MAVASKPIPPPQPTTLKAALAVQCNHMLGGLLCLQRSIQQCHYNISDTSRVGVGHLHFQVALERKAVEAELRVLYRQDYDTLEAGLVCILAYG